MKGDNDRRKYFMINFYERMLPTSVGVEPATSWSPVGRRIQVSHRGRKSPLQKRRGESVNTNSPGHLHQWRTPAGTEFQEPVFLEQMSCRLSAAKLEVGSYVVYQQQQ